MKKLKVSLNDVLSDDMSTPFWQSIMNNPEYANCVSDIDYILNQSQKHGKEFREIDPADLDPYDWKLK